MKHAHNVDVDAPGLTRTGLYLNPELSLLAFNHRVAAQATRPEIPLLERLRFLSISVSNLDEFFEVRVAALRQQAVYGVGQPGPDGRTPREALAEIAKDARRLVATQYDILNTQLLPALDEAGIRIVPPDRWTPEQRDWTRAYFEGAVLPILSATALDPQRPFPNIVNKRLNYIVELSGEDAYGRDAEVAIIHVPGPEVLSRVVRLPDMLSDGPWDFVALNALIEVHVDAVFPGMTVHGAHQFRLTRNSDLWVDEEEIDDLLAAIAVELPRRDYGDAVRLEVDRAMPDRLARLLLDEFELGLDELYRTDGPISLHRISSLHGEVGLPQLKFPPFRPSVAPELSGETDPFATLRQRDILLHHPFQRFQPVVELIRRASRDPAVLAIRMTLYRIGHDSPIAEALVSAARRGKDVTAIVELRARFDEENNIDIAQRLKASGANVVYGVVGRKTHAKMLLITRREGDRLRSYAHLSTGNYHTKTTSAYTDVGFLTADEGLTQDVADLFRQLTGLGQLPPPRYLVTAPFALMPHFERLIATEIEAATRGETAWIKARMNSLTDPGIIAALYRASNAGVEIDLVVRGMCSLRPQIPGVSDRIRVRSVVGRFLEHSRVFAFANGGSPSVWLASADWSPRNLHRRIETCFPIRDPALAQQIIDETLDLYLQDDVDAWSLDGDGVWRPSRADEDPSFRAQEALLTRYGAQQSPTEMDTTGRPT